MINYTIQITKNTPPLQNLAKARLIWDEITEGLIFKKDVFKYPDSIFFFKNNKGYFEYDLKNGILWCSYIDVWLVFENHLSFGFTEIQEFIKNQVEEHFKKKVVIPGSVYTFMRERWKNISKRRW